jgi:peptidoglycan hydrolase-like protein with peptidoglycan-binding domain
MNMKRLGALCMASMFALVAVVGTAEAMETTADSMKKEDAMMKKDDAMMGGDAMMKKDAMMSVDTDLTYGSTGEAVVSLQTFLESHSFLSIPAGVAKGYFGSLTKAALMKYQASVDVPATGYYGPITRGVMKQMMMKKDDAMMKKEDAMMEKKGQ